MENTAIKYCLYARKSSESDERQAMSIDSQIKEMSELAKREQLNVVEIRQESHSAKASLARPVFNQLLSDIENGLFNSILTWAPDRLSRNAGDLGRLVDLMDQGRLQTIRTYSQVFGNNPNEKFLLMILCSQAKLENDQKGLNVKRGIRAKCEMGWRPGIAPLGYMNRAFGGVKDIIVDPERAPRVQEMFHRVADYKQSGRTLKKWLDGSGFTTRQGKKITLSLIYLMLKNPFYYGMFKFPVSTGNWYQGKQTPLITKDVFDRVQKQLIVPRKTKWGSKGFAFKNLFICASCGSRLCGEEKFRQRHDGSIRHHIYYHCTRQIKYDCDEKYISEGELINQLLRYIRHLDFSNISINEKLQGMYLDFKKVSREILLQKEIDTEDDDIDFKSYAMYVLREGSNREKADFIRGLNIPFYLHNRSLQIKPAN